LNDDGDEDEDDDHDEVSFENPKQRNSSSHGTIPFLWNPVMMKIYHHSQEY
jgi:hypothetical protein